MPLPSIRALFAAPERARFELIDRARWRPGPLPDHGSRFFFHVSELCPVECRHCMASADRNRKSAKDSLSPDELATAIGFIDASNSEQLDITGGGEPFLKPRSVFRLIENVRVPRIDLVTAGYWAKTPRAATRVLDRLVDAVRRNPHRPELLLRLSLDRYHLTAPHPVRIEHYGNIVRAWQSCSDTLSLGLRGIQPDMGHVDRLLCEETGADLVVVDEWQRALTLPGGQSVPMTFNPFRASGKAADLTERDEMRRRSSTIREYYGEYEHGPGDLVLATTVNDAIRGRYADTGGLNITMHSDGRFWIVSGTSPDRQLTLSDADFHGAIEYFFRDPITRLLVDDGVWALADIIREIDPDTVGAVIARNDVTSLVDDLLAGADLRLAVTIVALHRQLDEGRVSLAATPEDHDIFLPEHEILRECRNAVRAGAVG